MNKKTRVLVTGAGGFIGHHLTTYLVNKGYWVRGVDIKKPLYEKTKAHEFMLLDLRDKKNALKATDTINEVYHLAANMGGIGFIETHKSEIVHDSGLINLNTIDAAQKNGISRFLFTSSACVYPSYRQHKTTVTPLKEEDVYPADPEDGYGWEKLFMEQVCQYYFEDFGLETRVARLHNVYGEYSTYEGGREKSPAAICRKIALAKDGDAIEIWGDGKQTRSYCYVADCVVGLHRLMRGNFHHPLNIGTNRLVSINDLVSIVTTISQKRIKKTYDLTKPQGVRGRNSDNTRLKKVLEWEPTISLEEGLKRTYLWIKKDLAKKSFTNHS